MEYYWVRETRRTREIKLTKLDDTVIKTRDRALRQILSDIVTLWNAGKMDFDVITAAPGDNPGGAEIRVFDNGTPGAFRMYFYGPSSKQWFRLTTASLETFTP